MSVATAKVIRDLFQYALTFEAAEQELLTLLKCAESGTSTSSMNAFSQCHKSKSTTKVPSSKQPADPKTHPPKQVTQLGSCNSCGESHAHSTVEPVLWSPGLSGHLSTLVTVMRSQIFPHTNVCIVVCIN